MNEPLKITGLFGSSKNPTYSCLSIRDNSHYGLDESAHSISMFALKWKKLDCEQKIIHIGVTNFVYDNKERN